MSKQRLLIQDSLGGRDLHAMFAVASKLLKRNLEHINAINVFPVADGDTGTNMFLTIQAATTASQKAQKSNSAAQVADALAHGALLGAKGNSGVILSQFFKGIAQALAGKSYINVKDFALALEQANKLAYLATDKPIEGTILTVIRKIAATAKESIKYPCTLAHFCENICKAADEAVSETPYLMPLLKQAGVVDAGGQALQIIFEGIRYYITGKKPKIMLPKHTVQTTSYNDQNKEDTLGCCTNFIIYDCDINLIKPHLDQVADSIIIVGDNKLLKIHLHTLDPVSLLNSLTNVGKLTQVQIDNMDEQHKDYQQKRLDTKPASLKLIVFIPEINFANIFIKLGINVVVLDKQDEPSLLAFLQPLSEKTILALNINPIISSSKKFHVNNGKNINIINLNHIPSAIAALASIDYDVPLAENIINISQACSTIKTGEINKQGHHFVGHLDTKFISQNISLLEVMAELLAQCNIKANQLLTLYYGNNITQQERAAIEKHITKIFPKLELEIAWPNHKSSYLFFSIE